MLVGVLFQQGLEGQLTHIGIEGSVRVDDLEFPLERFPVREADHVMVGIETGSKSAVLHVVRQGPDKREPVACNRLEHPLVAVRVVVGMQDELP